MGELLDSWLPDIVLEVLPAYEEDLDDFFHDKPYRKFLITDNGLHEVEQVRAHPQFKDYYMSCAPVLWEEA
jgi:hypothetical protein